MGILNRESYRDKVLGCWLGKNVGGTLGAPFEWRRQINNVSFYTQNLGGEPLPNDDLDIQLVWLRALEERGIVLRAATLAEYWCL
ncbi:MAG: ADP-ribosylglycohydrolase family protein, partial [Kiritimatiellia bacterium]